MAQCKWGKPGESYPTCNRPVKWYLSNDDVGAHVCDKHRKPMRQELEQYGQPIIEEACTD